MTTVGIGIIGCGNMGYEHADELEHIRQVRLIGFCNRTIGKAERFQERFQGEYATTDAKKIFDDPRIDAVYICTPQHTHADLCIQAAEAGKHIFAEKPLALTVADCKRVADAIEATGVKLMTGFKWRYYPVIQRARELIPHPLMIVAQMVDDRWPDDIWKQHPDLGGGSVVDQGCHTIDLLCYLAGSRPVQVYAQGAAFTHPDHPVVDHMMATITFENGKFGIAVQGDGALPPRAGKFMVEVFGEGRTAEVFDRFKQGVFKIGSRVEEMRRGGEEGTYFENMEFVRCLLEDTPPVCDVWDGLLATLLMHECFRSIATGEPQEIRWDGNRPVIDEQRYTPEQGVYHA